LRALLSFQTAAESLFCRLPTADCRLPTAVCYISGS
jgi:hypothetical protein